MTPYFSDDWLTIYQGDVRAVLPELASDSVDCIVTSPPYWGLRDYGTAQWERGSEDCDHSTARSRGDDIKPGDKQGTSAGSRPNTQRVCGKCGAVRQDSQIGLERTPEEYVANMVAVFRELRRVLKPSGTCWLNLGSSFASGDIGPSQSRQRGRAPAYGSDGIAPSGSLGPDSAYSDLCDGCLADWQNHLRRSADTNLPQPSDEQPPSLTGRGSGPQDSAPASPDASPLGVLESTTLQSWKQRRDPCSRCDSRASALSGARSSSDDAREYARNSWLKYSRSLKAKDLVPIPWMVAMALQEDGWYLRRDVIWNKPNPMPESVTDRPTSSHEYLFLLTKSARYYYDADAVREDGAGRLDRGKAVRGRLGEQGWMQEPLDNPAGRNLRSVWTIATRPYPGAHFAVFPPELPERCIKAGSSERGVCPDCGAPWERVVTVVRGERDDAGRTHSLKEQRNGKTPVPERGWESDRTTTGWLPSCLCGTGLPEDDSTRPAVVLDPFAGSGTTGMVANRLSRRAILIDLNGDYLKQQLKRNAQTPLGLAG